MPAWLIWFLIAAGLGVAELLTLTFVLGLMATAALVAALLGVIGLPVAVQIIGFAAATIAGLVFVRPLINRQLAKGVDTRSGADALVGRSAVVLQPVDGEQGRVKLSGEEWSARCIDEDLVIPAGTRVDVVEIDGATAVVYPRETLPGGSGPEGTDGNNRSGRY
ncbi:NfeD family protein [Nocardiopsis kunsanensis]|uniref:Membrane protein n=1 Tax=Nocardiopsis kunsanensis TaxID=141693 RepID=A0A918XJ33_9ACTN|nr:NfeD family protein [Nocardiopsis kunsanensis]GHD34088.1 membrane protein [Nocardiopsis kunsanensis]